VTIEFSVGAGLPELVEALFVFLGVSKGEGRPSTSSGKSVIEWRILLVVRRGSEYDIPLSYMPRLLLALGLAV
jgi:hypothetical protein